MSTFWEKVRAYANEQVKRQYMERFKHDRKCPNCKIWVSEVGGAYKVDYTESDHIEKMTCRQCGSSSKWDCSGMIPTLNKQQDSLTPKGSID